MARNDFEQDVQGRYGGVDLLLSHLPISVPRDGPRNDGPLETGQTDPLSINEEDHPHRKYRTADGCHGAESNLIPRFRNPGIRVEREQEPEP